MNPEEDPPSQLEMAQLLFVLVMAMAAVWAVHHGG